MTDTDDRSLARIHRLAERYLGATITRCERCGKEHLSEWVWLELNSTTGIYSLPGIVPEIESQGLFPFGPSCAKTVLARNGRNHSIRAAAK